MRKRCTTCEGKGYIEHVTVCEKCGGLGTTKMNMGTGAANEKSDKCKECNGKGKFTDSEPCPDDCDSGYLYSCDFCGAEINEDQNNVCEECSEEPYVIRFIKPVAKEYLNSKRAVAAIVTKTFKDEVLVDLGGGLKGKFKTAQARLFRPGQLIPVQLKRLVDPSKSWQYYVAPIRQKNFKIKVVHAEVPDRSIAEFKEKGVDQVTGRFIGQIVNVKRLKKGPSFFTLFDASGETIVGTAFGMGGRPAYPKYDRGAIVEVLGEMTMYKGQQRFTIHSFKPVPFEQRQALFRKLAEVVLRKSMKISDMDLSISSSNMEQFKNDIQKAAIQIREAVISGRNILLKYNSNSVDSTVAAYALDFALRGFLRSRGKKASEFRHIIKRIPLKGNVYETSDIMRDITFVLDGPVPGDRMPLVVLLNAGFSSDSIPAYKFAETYELPVISITHLGSDPEVREMITVVGAENRVHETKVSASMIAYEVARMVLAEYDFNFTYLPMIGAYHTRAIGEEYEHYKQALEANEETQMTEEIVKDSAAALEYVLYGLRFSDGGETIRDLIGIGRRRDKGIDLVKSLASLARSQIENALKVIKEHVVIEETSTGQIHLIDLEQYAPRFDYPSHGALVTAYHDQTPDNAVTVGIGFDYLIFRLSDSGKTFDELLAGLQEALPNAMISGGGYESVGSIRFISGFKNEVVDQLKKML